MKVEIEESELTDLKEAARKLDALEAAGVDNWSGYEDAMEMMSDDGE